MRDACQKLWDEKVPSVLTNLRTLYREARLFAMELGRKVTIVRALDQDQLSINDCNYGLTFHRKLIVDLTADVKVLHDKLCFGAKLPIEYNTIIDDPCNTHVDYCIRYRNDIKNAEARRFVLEHIINDPTLRDCFIESIDTESARPCVTFRQSGIDEYLKILDEYNWKIAVLVHLTSGMPARATEIVTNMVRSSSCALRTVHYAQRMVYLVTSYNKSNSSTGKTKKIARFVPQNVSDLLIADILYIRPLAAAMIATRSQEKSAEFHLSLFVNSKRRFDEKILKEKFKQVVKLFTGCHLTFSAYRHFAKYVMGHFKAHRLLKAVSAAEDEQFGHSKRSAQRYGLSNEGVGGSSLFELVRFQAISLEWHHLNQGHFLFPPLIEIFKRFDDDPSQASDSVDSPSSPRKSLRCSSEPEAVLPVSPKSLEIAPVSSCEKVNRKCLENDHISSKPRMIGKKPDSPKKNTSLLSVLSLASQAQTELTKNQSHTPDSKSKTRSPMSSLKIATTEPKSDVA